MTSRLQAVEMTILPVAEELYEAIEIPLDLRVCERQVEPMVPYRVT